MRTLKFLPLLLAGSCVLANANTPSNWNTKIGLLAMTFPKYQGSSHYKFLIVPDIETTYKKWFFFSIARGLGVNLVHTKKVKAGVGAKFDFASGRERSDDFPGLNNIKNYVSIFGFAKYTFFPYSVGANISHGTSRLDLGTQLNLNASLMLPLNKKLFITLSPNLTLADGNYADTYYSINTQQSASSGLGVYNASAGVTQLGLSVGIFYQFTPKWSSALIGNIKRYTGSTQNSPLIKHKVNYFAGLGVYYHFGKPNDTPKRP